MNGLRNKGNPDGGPVAKSPQLTAIRKEGPKYPATPNLPKDRLVAIVVKRSDQVLCDHLCWSSFYHMTLDEMNQFPVFEKSN